MAFFQKSVVNKFLKSQKRQTVEKAFEKFKAYFHNAEIQHNIRESKEEQFQEGFLRELFVNVLGYTLNPQPNYNLTTELKNEKGAKKADGAILQNGKALAVIELKGTNTKDLDKINTQAFNYKNNQTGCIYVITSNFEKLRFFIHNSVDHLEFNLFTLTKTEFELLWLCLNADSLLGGLPLKVKEESVLAEENITKQLYKDYSAFKIDLWQNMVKNSPRADQLLLFKKTQKLLDRFLFIFFSEDSGLLPPNSITRMVKRWKVLKEEDAYKPLYEIFKQYFEYINIGRKGKSSQDDIFAYNGGLFFDDEVLNNIVIDDEILHQHVMKLTSYDFQSEVDVNILGHIFENSLSEIENVIAKLAGKEVDKSKTKRKKDGVFYTPKYITKYIVENTVGKLCKEKKSELKIVDEAYTKGRKNRKKETLKALDKNLQAYRKWLLDITICDPACGSGAFLNQALEYLIEEHSYIDELESQLLGYSFEFPGVETHILEKNIYGVDINEESVEIAKLSLWLRTAQRGRKLTSLNNNIKCGNSLIDDPEVAGEKAFNWHNEFPEVFTRNGFDVVIGNPPYVDIKGLDNKIVKYLFQTFKSANNRVNLYSSFIEKSVGLMNNEGSFSFIIPSSLLTQDSYKELRQLLLEETTIKNIVRLPNESFGGSAGEVKVDTIILTFKSGIRINTKTKIIVYKGFDRITEISTYNSDLHFLVNPIDWKNDKNFLFRINVDDLTIEIVNKCQVNTKKLIDCAEFCLGLTPYDKYKGHSQEQIKNRVFHSNQQKDNSFRKLLAGNDITRYAVQWSKEEWISYGDWLGAPREKRFFSDKRILVKQIIDWSDKRIWAALTEEELYNTQNAFNLIPKDEYQAEYLIALINSRLMSFYHKKQFLEEFKDRFQKILIKDAKEFPIKPISVEQQQVYVEKVKQIIIQTAQLKKLASTFSRYISSQFSLDKLGRKLQNWHTLSFAEFITELNKAIKKAGSEKLTKTDEMEWMDLFETKKIEAQILKAEIDKTDKEIDQMVYELYGLTEEEIKIVEQS